MKLFNFLRKKKKKSVKDFKPLIDVMSNKKIVHKNKTIKSYKTNGYTFSLGDKVISSSNECNPLLVGVIVEFYNNHGKWSNCVPQIKDKDGVIWGSMGILRPYSKDLFDKISKMKPLEQWNYFVPKKYRYNKKDMTKKEVLYNKKMKNLNKIFQK